jgi:hypothetical protein
VAVHYFAQGFFDFEALFVRFQASYVRLHCFQQAAHCLEHFYRLVHWLHGCRQSTDETLLALNVRLQVNDVLAGLL